MAQVTFKPTPHHKSAVQSADRTISRKRKAHHKSRKGCGNCKLRRVKCDEKRPECEKCKDYGVSCSYDQDCSDLQLSKSGDFKIDILQMQPTVSTNKNMVSAINKQLDQNPSLPPYEFGAPFQLGNNDLKLLHMFQGRTVMTIGTERDWPIYRSQIMQLASSHDFLMHMVLTMTLMHDRFLSPTPNVKRSLSEAYHWYRGTMLFNRLLAGPINDSQKDALWITAALLGCVSFCHTEATAPEETWPLRAPSYDDLDWIRMSDGKKEVWKITEPLREGSVWKETASNRYIEGFVLKVEDKLLSVVELEELLPIAFVNLYNLENSPLGVDDDERSPYHLAISILAKLMPMACNHSTVLSFLTFISAMERGFRNLLEQKDARAMLILAYWHAKMCTYGQWWLFRRCLLECQSICIYLEERYNGQNAAEIRSLLQWPKSVCGLSVEFGAEMSAHWNRNSLASF